jgi:hypothetical protein
MNSTLNEKEKKDIYANLKAEYIYIFIPFCLLVGVRGYLDQWENILLAPDWSLVSCIIFGQITAKVSKAVSSSSNTNQAHFGLYTAKRFFYVVIALATYFGMLAKPSLGLGIFQILLFILASFKHFSDGFTTELLNKSK